MEIKGKNVTAIIDEGRSRKRIEQGVIKDVYDRIFTIEINGVITSFSYSDLICKTIVLQKV